MADNNVGTIYYDIDVRTDKAIDAVRTVEAANARAAKSFDATTKATTVFRDATGRLRNALGQFVKAADVAEDQIIDFNTAVKMGIPSAVKQAGGAVDDFGKQAGKTGAAMGALGKRAGMAGIQIQQLVGQVTAGTNPMQALSMQAADLGFVLGFPLAGAVAGITAAIAGPFITSLMNSEDQLDRVKEAVQTLRDELTKPTEAQTIRALEEDTKSLQTALRDLSSSSRDTRNDAKDALQEITGVESDIFGSMDNVIAAARKRIRQNTQLIEQQVASMQAKLAEDLQTPIPTSDGFELTDYFKEQDEARQRELDNRARYAMAVLAQQEAQARSETEAADAALKARMEAIAEAREQGITLTRSYNELEEEAATLHAERIAEIEQKQTDEQQKQLQQRLQAQQVYINSMSQLGGQLTNLVSTIGAEQTALGKAVFLANQALAVANIIVSTQQAAAQALTLDPTGTLSARVTALGYASAGIAAGVAVGQTASGRQTGGPTEAGQMYRVGEAGAPELYKVGGRQYLIGGERGSVEPMQAGSGGGVNMNVVINNAPGVSATASQNGDTLTISTFIADMNEHGPMHRSITSNTSATSKTK